MYLLPSPSPSSSELKSIVNMSSSSENSSPLSSLLPPPPTPPAPPSGRGFLLLFLLFLVIPPSLCCGPRFWTGSELPAMESRVNDVERKWLQKHTHLHKFENVFIHQGLPCWRELLLPSWDSINSSPLDIMGDVARWDGTTSCQQTWVYEVSDMIWMMTKFLSNCNCQYLMKTNLNRIIWISYKKTEELILILNWIQNAIMC